METERSFSRIYIFILKGPFFSPEKTLKKKPLAVLQLKMTLR